MDDKVVRGFAWTILSYGGNRVVTVATTIILARLLDPADFGLFALATLGINFISLLRPRSRPDTRPTPGP